ncbi:hypothetical protein V3M73_10500, partial [Trueperella pyogenes]
RHPAFHHSRTRQSTTVSNKQNWATFQPSLTSDVLDVEIATFEWVHWWTTTRLHQTRNYHTPNEVKTEYWQQQEESATIRNRVNT